MRIFINVRNSIRKILKESEDIGGSDLENIVITFDNRTTLEELKFIVEMLTNYGFKNVWEKHDYKDMMEYISYAEETDIPTDMPYVRINNNSIHYGSSLARNKNNKQITQDKIVSYKEFLINSEDIFDKLYESEDFDWVKNLGKPKRILFKDLKVGMTVIVSGLFDKHIQFNNKTGQIYKDTSLSGYSNIFIVFDDWHGGHNDQHKIQGDRTPHPDCKTRNCYYFDKGDGLRFYTIR